MVIRPSNFTTSSLLLNLWFVIFTIIWPIQFLVGGAIYKPYFLLILIAILIWGFTQNFSDKKLIKAFIVCTTIGVISLLSSFLIGACQDKHSKLLITFPVILILCTIGYSIGLRSNSSTWIGLRNCSKWILLVAIVELLIEFLVPEYFLEKKPYIDQFKYSGFFSEPSHLAYSVFPCVLLLLTSKNKKIKLYGVMSLVTLFIFSRTSTLIILTFISGFFWYLYRAKINNYVSALFFIPIGVYLFYELELSYLLLPTYERLYGIYEGGLGTNISSLVYLQGLQDAMGNLIRSYGFGIGFNMMGCNPLPISASREILTEIGISSLNVDDGSFLFSKIVSEFGIFGVLFFLYLFYKCKVLSNIKNSVNNIELKESIDIIIILILIYIAIFFVRGAGYFNGGFLMLAPVFGAISRIYCKKITSGDEPIH